MDYVIGQKVVKFNAAKIEGRGGPGQFLCSGYRNNNKKYKGFMFL